MKRVKGLLVAAAFASLGVVGNAQSAEVVLRGDYADPTILRDGADYYMTHSPFGYAPSFLIWHSRDLMHWEPVSRAMTGSAHAYAPELAKVGKQYYLYYPSNKTNYVLTASDMRGPWSAPVDLKVPRIDPGHIIGEDGKRYLFISGGYRTQLADDGLSAVGSVQHVYSGWAYPSDWKTECMCLESPKLFKKGEFFYMVSAEGGTAGPATSHMAVVARSKSIQGPWENSPINPVVHTYSADERWWSKGHATIIDDVNGNWWIVYHAYEKGAYTLGRMTLVDPIEWTADGWPTLAKTAHPLPEAHSSIKGGMPLSDEFDGTQLGIQWTSWGNVEGLSVADGKLNIQARGDRPGNAKQALVIPTDVSYEADTGVEIPDGGAGGLTLIYNDKAFAGLMLDRQTVTLYKSATEKTTTANRYGRKVRIKVVNHAERATFYLSADGKQWDEIGTEIDVSALNHNNYRGFLSLKLALAAAGNGNVQFDHFHYRALP